MNARSRNVSTDESFARRRRTYAPMVLMLAVVAGSDALPNVTVPGPETLFHDVVRDGGAGKLSSVTLPLMFVNAGCALLTAPAAEIAVRKLFDAPASATTVVPITPEAFLSWMPSTKSSDC